MDNPPEDRGTAMESVKKNTLADAIERLETKASLIRDAVMCPSPEVSKKEGSTEPQAADKIARYIKRIEKVIGKLDNVLRRVNSL